MIASFGVQASLVSSDQARANLHHLPGNRISQPLAGITILGRVSSGRVAPSWKRRRRKSGPSSRRVHWRYHAERACTGSESPGSRQEAGPFVLFALVSADQHQACSAGPAWRMLGFQEIKSPAAVPGRSRPELVVLNTCAVQFARLFDLGQFRSTTPLGSRRSCFGWR